MNEKSDQRIQIAQMSDLHYSGKTLNESSRCFESAVSDAIKRGVDVAIITGDSTDHAQSAHSPALLALAKQIQRLANHCPVLLLQGTFSHEPVGTLEYFKLLGAKHPIEVADRIGRVALRRGNWYWLDHDESGADAELVVSCMPTMNKADLASTPESTLIESAMGDVVSGLLSGYFGPRNEKTRREGVPTALIGHGTVGGCTTEHGWQAAGLDHEFSVGALFSAKTVATMLGHIHAHQTWERATPQDGLSQLIAYAGSIGRFHFGELGAKGFLLWDVGVNDCTLKFVETPASKMVDFSFDGPPDLEELKRNVPECTGAMVRVRYSIEEEGKSNVDRQAIKELFGSAADVQIECMVIPATRRRAAGISRLPTVADRFARWCESADVPLDGLLERLSQLQCETPSAIAEDILKRIQENAKAHLPNHGGTCRDGGPCDGAGLHVVGEEIGGAG